MGYAAEKKIVEARVKRAKGIALAIFAVFVLVACVFSCFYSPETWKYYFALPETGVREQGTMRVHFIDVGQGDCTLVELPDGKTMLVDGGNTSEQTATTVMRYLNALHIENIDYLVITHADTDHCGGLAKILQYKTFKRAFLPVVDGTEDETYALVYAKLMESGCELTYSARSVDLSADGDNGYTLSFLYPYTLQTETGAALDDNESSAVIWLDYQGTSLLLTGDAPSATEEKLVRDHRLGLLKDTVSLSDTEILKVAHHGSDSSTSEAFLQYLHIEAAVISCGEGNLYGHPTERVLASISAAGASVYRTDKQGHLLLTVQSSGEYAFAALGK